MKTSNFNHRTLITLSTLLVFIFFSCEKEGFISPLEQEFTSDITLRKGKPINYKVQLITPDPNIEVTCDGDNKQATGWVNFRDCIGVDTDDGKIRGGAGFILITDNTGRVVEVTFSIKNKGKKEPQYSTDVIPANQVGPDETTGDITIEILGINVPLRRHKNGTGNGGPIVNDNVVELTFGELYLKKQ